MDLKVIEKFKATVWRYYDEHGRHDLPWRLADADGAFDPYKIMVSEIMLQQTQVSRVMPKYLDFLERFPSVKALAEASLGEVLVAWQGLGYNRRAKFLWQAAQNVSNEADVSFPYEVTGLVALPGVGVNTAGAIMAYAYNQPVVFVETNIRSVYIHHFFRDGANVPDKAILELVRATLPVDHSKTRDVRHWYWALMDYGVHLKQTVGNSARASQTYVRQSRFEGSRRQVRGAVIRTLGQPKGGHPDAQGLQELIPDPRLADVLADLVREELIQLDSQSGRYRLS